MKTYVTYGFFWAAGGMVLTLALYFLGFHANVEKLAVSNWVGGIGGLAIAVTCLVLGTKARSAEVPPNEAFGYGRALGSGVMIALFAALFGLVAGFIYMKFVNPGFVDVMVQAQLSKMEAKGASAAQLDQAEKMIRAFSGPVISNCFNAVFGFIIGVVLALITSAFLKREAVEEPPAIA